MAYFGNRQTCWLGSLIVLAFAQSLQCLAQDVRVEHKREFTRHVSAHLLGSSEPTSLAEGGWRAFALAVPGAPLSPAITTFDPHGFTSTSLAQLYENMALFDRTFSVQNGVAIANDTVVPDVWDDILKRTLPRPPTDEERSAAELAGAILFRKEDSVDIVRGVTFLSEPSAAFKRYREYELLYRLIVRSKLDQDGAWRLHPRLAEFSSLAEAEETILSDWLVFGQRQQIETALSDFKRKANVGRWQSWTRSRKRFDNNQFPLDAYQSVAQTFLYPPANSWLTLSSWMRLSLTVRDVPVEFELVRIKIVRPWMSLSELLKSEFTLNPLFPNNGDYTLTDGAEPSFESFPKGRLAVFAEELILVRNIHWKDGNDIQDHPLGTYASPEAINLLGYVTRVLPAGLLQMEAANE
jgi:hypothetical protein